MLKEQVLQDASYQIKFTVHEEGELMGWGFLVVINNDRHQEPYGIMENVYVLPEHRGKGYGKQITSAIIKKAKELGCYKLLAQSRYSSEHVHSIYKKMGFSDYGKNFRMNLIDSKVIQED